jgi:phosphinothricin acetyltransferase
MSDLQLRIRAAREDDAAAIAAIYRPYVRDTAVSFEVEPPSPAVMAQRIQSTVETHPWLIAENGVGEIVGYVYAGKHRERPAYRWSVDTTIYIDQTRRRAGIGSMLYDTLLRVLRRQGFRSAFAEIVLPNSGSVRLHEAMGFEAVGVHRDVGFKLGQWHDIGYWRLGLASGLAPTPEPIPFAAFQALPDFVAMS